MFNYDFVDILKGFLKEDVERRDTIGVVYSDEFNQNDEEYFGENKVLWFCCKVFKTKLNFCKTE